MFLAAVCVVRNRGWVRGRRFRPIAYARMRAGVMLRRLGSASSRQNAQRVFGRVGAGPSPASERSANAGTTRSLGVAVVRMFLPSLGGVVGRARRARGNSVVSGVAVERAFRGEVRGERRPSRSASRFGGSRVSVGGVGGKWL